MLADIDQDTVDFQPNYDETHQEPRGPAGAASRTCWSTARRASPSGMATNIPPHNLGEVCDAVVALIDNPEIDLDELLEIVKGPDFPTGGIHLRHASEAGPRRRTATGPRPHRHAGQAPTIEESSKDGRAQIIVTELPYQVNKAAAASRRSPSWSTTGRSTASADMRDESRPQRHAHRHRAQARGQAATSSSTSSTSTRRMQATFA